MAIELVSEIVSRTTEVCSLFKMLQLPNGTQMIKNISNDRRKRLRDVHGFIVNHFRTLNAIHTRILQDQTNQQHEIQEQVSLKKVTRPVKSKQFLIELRSRTMGSI